jgi:hypothetical protein
MSPSDTWRLLHRYWNSIAAAAEQAGDLDALVEAEGEAAAAMRMVDILTGASPGPAETWKRLGRAVAA